MAPNENKILIKILFSKTCDQMNFHITYSLQEYPIYSSQDSTNSEGMYIVYLRYKNRFCYYFVIDHVSKNSFTTEKTII